jgi:hypothetical protein
MQSLPAHDTPVFPKDKPNSTSATVRLLQDLVASDGIQLSSDEFITTIDQRATSAILILFDGLDTGFGSTARERQRRTEALEGLFSFLINRGDSLSHIKFKVLLREDIWRSLKFENKSHFFGRSVELHWEDQVQLFKVALKRAVLSPTFALMIDKSLPHSGLSKVAVSEWSEADVFAVWNILVGERMKGGKAAFTRNWVWNRLADGNDDHSPRYLLQLMHAATEWERAESARSSYEKSVIRPRALIEVLPTVSGEALSAIKDEEFPELASLMAELQRIGHTPLDESELTESDQISLAREVGLLGIYEGTEDRVERYKVPEIFRYALKMSRKGQA